MALVPLMLFAEVNNSMMLAYMVVTDFLAVLPWAIKGAELLVVGLSEYFSARTMVYGDLRSANTVVAATWSCQCTAGQNLTAYGAAFVAVAVAAMICCVSLEFLAKAKVDMNKLSAKQKMAFSGHGVEYLLECRPLCRDCDCHGPGGGLIGQMLKHR